MRVEFFNITWRNITENLIPWFWRNVTAFRENAENPTWLIEYTFCITNTLQSITDRLFVVASDIKQELLYSGQWTVLEFCLNDYFDPFPRRIFLSEDFTAATNWNSLYLTGELQPDPFSLYLQSEVNPDPISLNINTWAAGDYDFYVNVPNLLVYDPDRMAQIIETYKTAGKRYLIQTF